MIAPLTLCHMENPETERAYRPTIIDAICVACSHSLLPPLCSPGVTRGFSRRRDAEHGDLLASRGREIAPGKHVLSFYFRTPHLLIAQEVLSIIFHSITSLAWILYRIGLSRVSILAASIPVVYHLADVSPHSRSIAFLAVLALCYHPRARQSRVRWRIHL